MRLDFPARTSRVQCAWSARIFLCPLLSEHCRQRNVQGKWHFWGSDWPHGDWLLFGSSTAQIMYAYVMRSGGYSRLRNIHGVGSDWFILGLDFPHCIVVEAGRLSCLPPSLGHCASSRFCLNPGNPWPFRMAPANAGYVLAARSKDKHLRRSFASLPVLQARDAANGLLELCRQCRANPQEDPEGRARNVATLCPLAELPGLNCLPSLLPRRQ